MGGGRQMLRRSMKLACRTRTYGDMTMIERLLSVCTRWLLLVMLTGCARMTAPDLAQLYARHRETVRQPPVVIVHGVFGARLADSATGEEKWPGPLWRVLLHDYRDIALTAIARDNITRDNITREDIARKDIAPPTLQPTGITDRVAGREFYARIMQTLETAGQFRRLEPGQPVTEPGRHYYVFAYDWRRDNAENARQLDQFLRQIRQDHNAPAQKVDLVAHSMGGLLVRYFLRYGADDVLNDNELQPTGAGGEFVRRVILLGTPNLGSVTALQHALEGYPVGLKRIPPEVLATFPSLFQLLPHPIHDWLFTADGKPLERDLFDIEVWRRFEWSIFSPEVRARVLQQYPDAASGEVALAELAQQMHRNLERARRFVWALTVPESRDVRSLIVFGGDCTETPARVVVEEEQGDSVLRLYPDDVRNRHPGIDYRQLMLEPGDGAVTKPSLLATTELDPTVPRHRYSFFPLAYPVLLCEEHDQLTENVSFQDNLLHALLTPDPH